MESTLLTIVFRSAAIIIGLLMAIFSYLIYKATRGSSKGWLYLTIFGTSLFFWSTSAMLFKLADWFWPRVISGIIFLIMMAYFVPISYTKLAEDLGVKRPKWLTTRFTAYLVTIILIIVLIFNSFLGDYFGMDFLARKLLSVAHWSLGLTILFACLPTYLLMISTKKSPWILAFMFTLIIGVGLNLGQYYDGCCGEGGQLKDENICSKYDLDYMKVYDLPCSESLVGLGMKYQLFLLLGIILGDISFYQLWRRLA